MSNHSILKRTLAVIAVTFTLAACSNDGAMEEAGEEIDQAAVNAQNAVEDSCENLKESLNAADQDC
ncbi:hypothetical protein [Marinomonas sp.]